MVVGLLYYLDGYCLDGYHGVFGRFAPLAVRDVSSFWVYTYICLRLILSTSVQLLEVVSSELFHFPEEENGRATRGNYLIVGEMQSCLLRVHDYFCLPCASQCTWFLQFPAWILLHFPNLCQALFLPIDGKPILIFVV